MARRFKRPGIALQLACLLLSSLCFAATPARSQSLSRAVSSNEPVLLTADNLTYDQNLGQITAQGHVELAQAGRTMLADSVAYSERDGKVTASGNVSLMQDDGTVLFADYIELTDEMRNGFVRDARLLLSDNSRAAAASATRTNGNRLVMNKAVYTACALCATDPSRPPLWQVKADKVVHDQTEQQISYNNATLEFFGVPVAYTPYFSHPDPTVQRKSGFLPPVMTNNRFFGTALRTPYYYVIDDQSDLTLGPQYSTNEGGYLDAEYRQRFNKGEIRFDGSIAESHKRDFRNVRLDDTELRGHIRADALFRANDDFDYGFNIFRSSDDTYLSRYRIPGRSGNTLVSRVFAEGVNGRNFAAANAYSFQGLRTDAVPGLTPFVAPLLDYSMVGEPGERGGRWAVDANLAALYRTGGTDTRRLSSTVSWSQPYIAPSGEVYTATAALKGDFYWVDELQDRPFQLTDQAETHFVGRAVPVVALDWRYPLVRDDGTIRQLIEPIAGVVLTPYSGNSRRIPNEDSPTFEFDETNLFSLNRFPGIDRFDGGPKVNYGLRSAVYGSHGGYTELLVGQSFRLKSDDQFGEGSGMNDQLSDYVARLTVAPTSYFSITDRLRLGQNRTLSVQRQEISANLGPRNANLTVSYADLQNTAFVQEITRREAISLGGFLQIDKYWSIEGRHVRDLGDGGGALLHFAGLRYTDECFDIMLFAERTFTVNRDIQPSTTIGLRFRIASFN